MAQSFKRILHSGSDPGWILPDVDIATIWNSIQWNVGGTQPEWFSDEVRQCVKDYLGYATKIEGSLVPADFSEKCKKIANALRKVSDLSENLEQNEKNLIVDRLAGLMPDEYKRVQLYTPERFLHDIVRQLGEYANAIEKLSDTLVARREQKTDELIAPVDTFERSFDRFVRNMESVAERIGIEISASKDAKYSAPSPFVVFICKTLTTFEDAITEAQIDNLIADDGKKFDIVQRTLQSHTHSQDAISSAVSAALKRIRAGRSG